MADYLTTMISQVRWVDFLDISIIAFAIYKILKFIQETRAAQLLKGLIVLLIATVLSDVLKLYTVNWLLDGLLKVGAIALIVIFQPELRTLLEKMGRLKVGHFLGIAADPFGEKRITETVIESVSRAAAEMSQSRTGALIVIERHTRLGEYMNSGTLMNADVSSELLGNIFVPSTPLHDGAVIIRDNKIITAGCVLPLTANTNLASELGTRHRAALGLSEASDAVIVVVSEETGKISIAINGSLTRNLTEQSLKKALTKLLTVTETADIETVKKIFRKNR